MQSFSKKEVLKLVRIKNALMVEFSLISRCSNVLPVDFIIVHH